jgi:L-2-hydroxyglutarate oxidase LhgO
MKIAIIGGGFYGCYIAYKISDCYPKIEISIYEKNNKLLLESAINNQYRLHQGFHYPRSIKTIRQTKVGFKQFCKEFKKFIFFPKKNYYLIHKKSRVAIKEYKQIYKKQNLKFKNLSLNKISFLKDISQYSGAIKVSEGVIKLSSLYNYINKKIFSNNNTKIFYNSNVIRINKKKGTIFTKKKEGPFDLIIN